MNLQEIANTLEFELEDVEMLMDLFLDDANASLKNINTMIASNNYSEMKNIAHGIKGSASNLLLEEIMKIAQKIEQLAKTESPADYAEMFESLKIKLFEAQEMKVQTCM